jgi:nucleotide-binding universal stress UspA family protein
MGRATSAAAKAPTQRFHDIACTAVEFAGAARSPRQGDQTGGYRGSPRFRRSLGEWPFPWWAWSAARPDAVRPYRRPSLPTGRARARSGPVSSSVRGGRPVKITAHAAGYDALTAILNVVTVQGADLIVVGNKGMSDRTLGSVPNEVFHRAACDVLIVNTT